MLLRCEERFMSFKDLTESDLLIFRGTLFQNHVANTAKKRPLSVSRL